MACQCCPGLWECCGEKGLVEAVTLCSYRLGELPNWGLVGITLLLSEDKKKRGRKSTEGDMYV